MDTEHQDAIDWLEEDARYLNQRAESYEAKPNPVADWIAKQTREAAEHSTKLAQQLKTQVEEQRRGI